MLSSRTKPVHTEVGVGDAHRAAASGAAALIDVRRDDEWQAGHSPNAIHIALHELPARTAELPTGPLYLICHAGVRSTQACLFLAQQGYSKLSNVTGGMAAWEAAGLPVVGET